MMQCACDCFCFFNDTATTEIYTDGHTLALHDALPICRCCWAARCAMTIMMISAARSHGAQRLVSTRLRASRCVASRSEEHTSELQSLMRNSYAVFCLKKKKKTTTHIL